MTKQVRQAITPTHILGSTGTAEGDDLGFQSKADFVVGTVSQSGGVPTGAIIQRGSNANGEFVRYADGTQICTMEVSGLVIDREADALYRLDSNIEVNFPVSFSNTNYSFYGYPSDSTVSVRAIWVASGSPLNSMFVDKISGVDLLSTRDEDGEHSCRFTAIGRWF